MNYAEEIKSRVPAKQMFEFYGFKINRAGFCLSPFSSEKTPSLKIYDGSCGWHCFSTGEGGSVIDFVMRYFSLDFQSACKKLNDDFALGLPFGQPLTVAQYKKINQDAEQRRIEQLKRKKRRGRLSEAYNALMDLWVKLDNIKREKAPKQSQSGFNDDYVFAVKHIDYVSYMLDNVLCEMHELGI